MSNQQQTTLTPTPVSEWRKLREEGEVSELPSSGRVVRWRPVALSVLVATGEIPNVLASEAARVLWTEEGPDERSTVQKVIDWNGLVGYVVAASLIEPRVVVPSKENPNPQLAGDEILLSDLSPMEQLDIYGWAVNASKAVRRFRSQQEGDVEAVSEGGEGGEAAE